MMRSLFECKSCGETHFTDEKCKPVYYYNIPGQYGEDEWSKVRANSFHGAAEQACIDSDSDGDHTIVRSGGINEILIKDESGVIKRFKVFAEAVPQYYPEEIKEATA